MWYTESVNVFVCSHALSDRRCRQFRDRHEQAGVHLPGDTRTELPTCSVLEGLLA